MADVRVELEEILESTRPSAPRRRSEWGRWAAGATLVVLVAGALIAYFKSRAGTTTTDSSRPPMRTVPLTTYPGAEYLASFSPGGSQFTFTWKRGEETFAVYVKLIGPGEPIRLTTGPAASWHSVWSPDGRFVAFFKGGEKRGLFIVPALGGRERRLAATTGFLDASFVSGGAPNITWSPDSRWLVFPDREIRDDPLSLYLISIDTGEKRNLTVPPEDIPGDGAPAFSPDGRALVFKRRMVSQGASQLCLISLSEKLEPVGQPQQIVSDGWRIGTPVWSPDGDILFSGKPAEGNWDLWRIRVSSGKFSAPERHPDFGKRVDVMSISRDGTRLAYVEEIWDPNIWTIELPDENREVGPPLNLISSTRAESQPQFSPDGSRVVFTSDRSGTGEIWVCDPDGSNAAQLTQFGGLNTGMPSWSPNGDQILFASDSDGQVDIYRVGVNGGEAKRLTDHPAGDYWPWWSRNGDWIYFSSGRSGEMQIWRMPAEDGRKIPASGGNASQVTTNGGDVPRDSRDGRSIYFVKTYDRPSALWRIPADGGEEELVLDAKINWGCFAVTDHGIYFVCRKAMGKGPGENVEFLSFHTGKTHVIREDRRVSQAGIAVSPDGRWLLHTMVTYTSDLMLVENFHWPGDTR